MTTRVVEEEDKKKKEKKAAAIALLRLARSFSSFVTLYPLKRMKKGTWL
jgi:hypothetical protein